MIIKGNKMADIKIIFFDIDGTLLNMGSTDLTTPVKNALRDLQDRGIKVFVATGRPHYSVPVFEDVIFDGFMCFNGAYCFDRETVIHTCCLDKTDMRTVVANAGRLGYATQIATADRMGCNMYQEELDRYIRHSRRRCDILPDFDEMLSGEVFLMMVASGEEHDKALLENTTRLRTARWCDWATDIISVDCGKAKGIQAILDHYGFRREESMAFGDGHNDLDMIEYAGIGVAMGNAKDEVKAAADYVTDSCEDDGVVTALEALLG